MDHQQDLGINHVISLLRLKNRRHIERFDTVSDINTELRNRRKRIIGSDLSLEKSVKPTGVLDEKLVADLCACLTQWSVALWRVPLDLAEDFCSRFFTLAVYAIASGNVGSESFDDIIQLAACLVRSRDTFTVVMKDLLPADLISSLFYFTEHFDAEYYAPTFEDAVLGAVSVLMGSLNDPLAEPGQ